MSSTYLRPGIGRRILASCIALSLSAAVSAETLSAPGLSAPGSIAYDAEGVPTITAANDNDAAFLQGYAHAQYRFYQMDYTRRAVSGTLAELLGQAALSSDIQTRTLGLRRGAERSWRAMSDDMRGWIEAYTNGVNHWLSTTAALPPEYGALSLTRATPWSPVDTVVVGKGLAFQLSFDLDIDATIQLGTYQAAATAAGLNATALYFNDIFRAAPADNRVTIPGFVPGAAAAPESTQAMAVTVEGDAPITEVEPIAADTLALAKQYREAISGNALLSKALDGNDSPIGSNEWVVSGAHTASGKPILSNDPHLGLDLPSVFTEQHVFSNDSRYPAPMDVTGVTIPGAPGVIQGCNQGMCWGTTTNSLDVTDVFQETLRLNSYGLPYAIVHNGVEEPVQWLFQNYYVNQMSGGPDNIKRDNSIGYTNGGVTIIVPRRNNGAIVSLTGSTGLSVAYTGWGPTKELESFRRINRATNVAQFQDALTYFDFGSQNFAYADQAGNIAYFTSAEAPVRIDLQTTGQPGGGRPPWLIRDGSGALKHDWMPVVNRQPNQATPYEILPANEMPYVINPASGYIANANNDPIGFSLTNNVLSKTRPGGGVYYLDSGGASAFRMGRIDRELQRMIASGIPITADDMADLQANNQLLDAELILPQLLGAYDRSVASGAWADAATLAGNAKVAEAISRLRAWDFSTPTGIPQGYDAGDNPASLPAPSQQEINHSVAATIWATWRAAALRNTIDAALTKIGLGSSLPGGRDALTALKYQLDNYATLNGKGASGINFFAVTGAPTPAAARDFLLLKSLKDGLDRLASSDFNAAFAGSTELSDYRWGKLHRIVFDHSLGGPFNIPGTNPYPFQNLGTGLPGISRPGGFEAVDASAHDLRANGVNSFMFGSGPARRFVGEMTLPTIDAAQILPGGPSGVIGSPFYVSQLSRWLTNHYKPLPIPHADALAQSPTVIDFTP